MAAYGEIIACNIERSTLDTDDIILNITKKKSAFDITGWTADLTINTAKDGSGGANIFEAAGIVFGAATNGQIAIDMGSFAVTAGKYFYDVRIIDAGGKGREYLAGKFTVIQRIEKA